MTDRPDLHTLTGAYAVDALPEDERERFESHLAVCPPCALEVRELQATAARLGATSVAGPPASMRDEVLARIDTVRQERPVTAPVVTALRDRRDASSWFAPALGVAAGLLLLVVAGLTAVVVDLRDQVSGLEVAAAADRDERQVATAAADRADREVARMAARVAELESRLDDPVLVMTSALVDVMGAPDVITVSVTHDRTLGRVVASPTRGEAVFIAEGWEPAPHAHTYELWIITPDGAVPAGLFDPDERGRATRVMTGDLAGATAVGVTIEPEGGSPVPSSEPMMVLQLS